jgi:hypothetical protein
MTIGVSTTGRSFITVGKRHPCLQTFGPRKSYVSLASFYKAPSLELPGLLLNFGPLLVRAWGAAQLLGPFFTTCYI